MKRHEQRGRLVTPDPSLEDVYRSLGASTTHCDVRPADGGLFTCRSTGEFSDSARHRDRATFDIVKCPACIPVGAEVCACNCCDHARSA